MPDHQKRRADDQVPGVDRLLSGAPWWARFVVFLLFYFLGPSALAVLLLLAAFGFIQSPITETKTAVDGLAASLQRARTAQGRNTRALRLLCRRLSKTSEHFGECEEVMRPPAGPDP